MELPAVLQIEPVGRCNLRCTMCSAPLRPPTPDSSRKELSYDRFCTILDQFPRLDTIVLQGLGEPLLHPRFFDMVAYATKKSRNVISTTNLTAMTGARARQTVLSGLTELNVSIDAASAEVYEKIRVGAAFDRVLANLAELIRQRRLLGKERPLIRLVFVLMQQNLHEVPAVVRLAARFGVRDVFVQYLCHDFREESLPEIYQPMVDFVEQQAISLEMADQVESIFAEARQEAVRRRVELRLPLAGLRRRRVARRGQPRCHWPWTSIYISYDGQVMPCCMVATPDRCPMGSIETSSIERIWNGPTYRRFRTQLLSATPPSVCRCCSSYRQLF